MALAAVGSTAFWHITSPAVRVRSVSHGSGAGSVHVRGLVVKEVALMLVIGTVLGLGAAVATGRLLQAYLFGLKPTDPLVYSLAAALLWLIAAAAAYIPARRPSQWILWSPCATNDIWSCRRRAEHPGLPGHMLAA